MTNRLISTKVFRVDGAQSETVVGEEEFYEILIDTIRYNDGFVFYVAGEGIATVRCREPGVVQDLIVKLRRHYANLRSRHQKHASDERKSSG